jgi:hypothetical protein
MKSVPDGQGPTGFQIGNLRIVNIVAARKNRVWRNAKIGARVHGPGEEV